MADIFGGSALTADPLKKEAMEKLQTLKERSTSSPDTPIMETVAAKAGVPAHDVQVGTQTHDDAAILPWEAKRRADRISQEYADKTAARDQADAVSKAQDQVATLVDQLDRRNKVADPNAPSFTARLAQAQQDGFKSFAQTSNLILTQANQDEKMGGIGAAEARKLADSLAVIGKSHIQQIGTQGALGEDHPAYRGLGGMPPVNTLTPDAAGAAGLPIDAILRNRAASGQPVFVGQGDNVARLAGPNSPPTSTTPSTSADIYGRPPQATTVPPMQASAPAAPPKDHAHHISDMVKAGISGIAKLTGLYPGGASPTPDMSGAPMPGASPETMVSAAQPVSTAKMDAGTFARQYASSHPGSTPDEARQAYLAYVQG